MLFKLDNIKNLYFTPHIWETQSILEIQNAYYIAGQSWIFIALNKLMNY